MLDGMKRGLRGKVIRAVEVGVDETRREVERAGEASKEREQTIQDSIREEAERSANAREFVSLEYVLDAVTTSTERRPRVLVCGFYGGRNLGDELMLQAILKRLDTRKVDICIMLDGNYEIDASIYAPYKVIHYPKKNNDILYLAQQFDYIVWGGGAVLDDRWYGFSYSRVGLGYILLKVSIAAIKCGKKVLALGVSTNQVLEDEEFLRDVQKAIQGAEYFSLRDTNSLASLEKAGVKCKGVQIIDDIAIADLPVEVGEKKKPNNTVCLGISFMSDAGEIERLGEFSREAIQAIRLEYPRKKVAIRLIPFFESKRLDGDRVMFEKMVEAGYFDEADSAQMNAFPNDMQELVQTLKECDCYVSMRYHGALVASAIGVKTLVIDHSKTHRHYFNKLNYIQERYCKFQMIRLDEITEREKVRTAIKATLEQGEKRIERRVIEEADQTLRGLCGRVR